MVPIDRYGSSEDNGIDGHRLIALEHCACVR